MKIHTVLVRPEYASNVGSAARAIANMGGDDLIIIDCQCTLGVAAKATAAGAHNVLRRARHYPSWSDFLKNEGEGLRLALTRRTGRQRKVFPLVEKVKLLTEREFNNLYLIFGPEADGLSQSDLSHANFAVHLPIYGQFASMNLAQAVLLTLFIVRQSAPPEVRPVQTKGTPEQPVQALYFPDDLIKEWLTTMGFDIKARRASAYLTLRKLFLQNLPTRHEIQVLEAILQQNIRKLKKVIPLFDERAD